MPTPVQQVLPTYSAPPINFASDPLSSHRSLINMNNQFYHEYMFIDHIKWSTSFVVLPTLSDSEGWPNVSTAVTPQNNSFGGIFLPASSDYSDYTVDGFGTGSIFFGDGGWAFVSGTGAFLSGNTLNVTDQGPGVRWSARLTYIGPRTLFGIHNSSNDPGQTGAYVRRVRFYRTVDAADLAAGKVFRAPFKQALVNLCPSAIRFMNWTGGNNCHECRWENRTLPSYAVYGDTNWRASPLYGSTSGVNIMTLAGVTGTPAASTHGEIVTCRIGAGQARSNNATVTNVTRANPGVVTTSAAHGYATGDKISHLVSSGMTQLDYRLVTITVISPTTYSIGLDTSSFSAWSGTATAYQVVTLNVAGRGAYPVIFEDGHAFASNYGDGYIATGQYKTFYFDKNLSVQKDAAGNWIYGVWMFNDAGDFNPHQPMVPPEICTALINELNAMSPVHTIHMWVCAPHRGLLSVDPDYSSGSNFAANMVNTILNGANGYAGLDPNCTLLIEFSNETWNAVNQSYYLARLGVLRQNLGFADYATMTSLRSTITARDIKAATSNNPRIKYIMAGQGTQGYSALNQLRCEGSAGYFSDPWNTWSTAPIVDHDAFCWASYFDSPIDWSGMGLPAQWQANAGNAAAQAANVQTLVDAFVSTGVNSGETMWRYGNILLPQFANALNGFGKKVIQYEGGWDTRISQRGSAPDTTMHGDITNGSNVMLNVDTSTFSVGDYVMARGVPDQTTITAKTASTLTMSKNATATRTSTDVWAMSLDNRYLWEVKRSQAWSDAWITYLNYWNSISNAAGASDYTIQDIWWGHAWQNSYLNGVEGANYDTAFIASGNRNRAQSDGTVRSWAQLPVGPGGNVIGGMFANDGTQVCRTDTGGAYVNTQSNRTWRQLITLSSMPAGKVALLGGYAGGGLGNFEGVLAVACAPSNGNRIYLYWVSEVFRSDDGGATFSTTGFSPVTVTVNGATPSSWGPFITVHPTNPDILFVSTPSNGLFYSSNGGTSFAQKTAVGTATNPGNEGGGHIVAFESSSSIYASTYGTGVYHSSDSGANWTLLNSSGMPTTMQRMVFSNGKLFVIESDSSTTITVWNGSAWSTTDPYAVSALGGGDYVQDVAVDPANSARLVAYNVNGRLSISTDTGATWSGFCGPPLRVSDQIPWMATTTHSNFASAACAFNPAASNELWIYDGVGTWKTTPLNLTSSSSVTPATGSMTFTVATGLTNIPIGGVIGYYATADHNEYGFGPITSYNSGTGALTFNCTFINGSTTRSSWVIRVPQQCTETGRGMEQMINNRVIVPPSSRPYIALWDRVGFYSPGNSAYPSNQSYVATTPEIIAGWDADYVYGTSTVITLADWFGTNYSGISTNYGQTFTKFVTAPRQIGQGGSCAASSVSNYCFFPAGSSNNPQYTTDSGSTWHDCTFPAAVPTSGTTGWNSFYANNVKDVCADYSTAGVFYAYNNVTGKVYRSTDSGANWSLRGTPSTVSGITYIKSVPQTGSTSTLGWVVLGAVMVGSGALQRSKDGGATWALLGGFTSIAGFGFGAPGAGQTVPAICVAGIRSGTRGLWQSLDDGATWTDLSSGYTDADQIYDVDGDKGTAGVWYVATTSTGIWRYG